MKKLKPDEQIVIPTNNDIWTKSLYEVVNHKYKEHGFAIHFIKTIEDYFPDDHPINKTYLVEVLVSDSGHDRYFYSMRVSFDFVENVPDHLDHIAETFFTRKTPNP